MITLTDLSKDIAEMIREEVGETEWNVVSDLGELGDNKDLIAYFAAISQNSVIPNNNTLKIETQLVATLLFETRTAAEMRAMVNQVSDATLTVLKRLERYMELPCGAVFLEAEPGVASTDTDDLYYTFVLPIGIYAQF